MIRSYCLNCNMLQLTSLYFTTIVLLQILGTATAYVCYQCSYGLWADGDYRECIENPDALGFSHHLHCNRTSYCVLQEQYDISRKTVTSYFRSCSGTIWGDQCSETGGLVTCKYSCQGDLCNQKEVGRRYEPYLARHPHRGHSWNSSSPMSVSVFSLALCLLLTLMFL